MATNAYTDAVRISRPEDCEFTLGPRAVRVVTGERGGKFWKLYLLRLHLRENQGIHVFWSQVKTLHEHCYLG